MIKLSPTTSDRLWLAIECNSLRSCIDDAKLLRQVCARKRDRTLRIGRPISELIGAHKDCRIGIDCRRLSCNQAREKTGKEQQSKNRAEVNADFHDCWQARMLLLMSIRSNNRIKSSHKPGPC